ncbi:hypothetical protein F7725_011074 [Dissostichus mawsoni]|uniref:Sulfatase N-terminal domain-containing protein n=1 Tax=Dissostichus mawsoni TaxID=36200 RepID=A0A7J5Z8K1_DISMA|nr:hypothetical protein F7725_011074 [Dissostichus mawsoni]
MHAAAAAAVALAVLSVFCRFDQLSAQRAKQNQNQTDRNNQTDETEPKKKKNQPHIIFILIDDQGFNDIGYHNPTIKTPTLDKLAAEGVTLENYYVQPICTPYQIHTGLQHSIIRPSQPSCLPAHMDTLPERLREAGYSTHMVSLGPIRISFTGLQPLKIQKRDRKLQRICEKQHSLSCFEAGLCLDVASLKLDNNIKASLAVHTPLQPPKSYIYPYRDMANVARRKFAAMVSTVDEAVRNVTYALRKLGYYRNSVIIYSTDNGAQPPLLRRRRRVSKALLHITDWFPTLVGLAGGNISQRGKESPRQEILHNIDPLHKSPSQTMKWDVSTERAMASKSKGPKKPKKKKILRQKPKQKSAFRVKKPQTFTRPAAKPAPTLKSKPSPKTKLKPSPKTKLKPSPKTKLKPSPKTKLKPSPKTKLKPVPKIAKKEVIKQKLKPVPKPKLKPVLKSKPKPTSRTKVYPLTPRLPTYNPSGSGTSRPKSQPQIQPRLKRKSRRNTSQNFSHSRPPQRKSKTEHTLHFQSRRTSSEYQNMSQAGAPQPKSHPAPRFSFPSVWDASVQAAIRVGDWKLLTGDPGHGDWVPPQNVWLFNITADPCERQDLAAQRPDVVQQLMARLAFHNQTAVPVYFPPDDPRANPSRHSGAWVPWVEEEEDEEGKYHGVYKKGKNKKKRKKPKCPLCKLQSFFLKLNTGMMSNRI